MAPPLMRVIANSPRSATLGASGASLRSLVDGTAGERGLK